MNTITYNNAIKNFPQLIAGSIANNEETFIVSDQGSVVLIPETEWNAIQDTIKLFRDKKSLKALLLGHRKRRKGLKSKGKTIEEAFYDL